MSESEIRAFSPDPEPNIAPPGGAGARGLSRSDLPLPLLFRGKVRDIYEAGPGLLLLVATDRVSAFDVVLPQPVPAKGMVLTQITAWWLARLESAVPHHLVSVSPAEIRDAIPSLAGHEAEWAHRSMLVRGTQAIPVECVVRGYLSGSAWKEYRRSGTLAGEPLPPGLVESSRLDPPIFSPATKAREGHDENITHDEVVRKLGPERAEELRRHSLTLYQTGAAAALQNGIILADTKFEFGLNENNEVIIIDEVMTPDSSRFWPADTYAEGRSQPSLDKQPIRDYLDSLEGWNKKPPPPNLPDAVVAATTARYQEIFRRLTGIPLEDFQPPTFEAA
jgi:phosphoribosylaminoimidazole-succinocarboxamide synthase